MKLIILKVSREIRIYGINVLPVYLARLEKTFVKLISLKILSEMIFLFKLLFLLPMSQTKLSATR